MGVSAKCSLMEIYRPKIQARFYRRQTPPWYAAGSHEPVRKERLIQRSWARLYLLHRRWDMRGYVLRTGQGHETTGRAGQEERERFGGVRQTGPGPSLWRCRELFEAGGRRTGQHRSTLRMVGESLPADTVRQRFRRLEVLTSSTPSRP